jgi:hypothetical protein
MHDLWDFKDFRSSKHSRDRKPGSSEFQHLCSKRITGPLSKGIAVAPVPVFRSRDKREPIFRKLLRTRGWKLAGDCEVKLNDSSQVRQELKGRCGVSLWFASGRGLI